LKTKKQEQKMSDQILEKRILQLEQQQQDYMLFTLQAFQLVMGSDESNRHKVLEALRKIILHAAQTPLLSPVQLQLMQTLREMLIAKGTADLDQLYNQPHVRPVDYQNS